MSIWVQFGTETTVSRKQEQRPDLIQSVALLSRSGCPMSELQAMSMERPRDTRRTPAGEGGGRRVIRETCRQV